MTLRNPWRYPAIEPGITLVYDADCPNLPAARLALREALELAFVSALGWLCCLPIASGAFGVALAAIAATVGPWWPLLATLSLVFLVITVVRAVRGTGGSAVHSCEMLNRRRRQWLFLSAVGALTLLLLTLPWWSADLTYRLIR